MPVSLSHSNVLTRNADLWLAAVLTVAGIYFFSGRFTTVRFDRERIEVRVERGLIQVTGLYHYANRSRLPAVLTLGVPFPVDREHPPPATFSLSEATEQGRPLLEVFPILVGGDVRFRLFFGPGEAKWIRLDYSQPARAPQGRYLLTTTRAWRRPIASASFRLRLPHCSSLGSSNYALSDSPDSGRGTSYSFSQTNFYPDRDWEFTWKERPGCAAPHQGDAL